MFLNSFSVRTLGMIVSFGYGGGLGGTRAVTLGDLAFGKPAKHTWQLLCLLANDTSTRNHKVELNDLSVRQLVEVNDLITMVALWFHLHDCAGAKGVSFRLLPASSEDNGHKDQYKNVVKVHFSSK